ncbi:MAG: response regulator [bacterium]
MKNNSDVFILVVDDDESIRGLVEEILLIDGYSTVQASNGTEALEILQNQDFDLLITDIMMPGISGMKLLTTVRNLKPDMAIIMLTSVDKKETAIQAIEQGAYGYMIKPFQVNELLMNVFSALHRRKSEKMRDDYEKELEKQIHEINKEFRNKEWLNNHGREKI